MSIEWAVPVPYETQLDVLIVVGATPSEEIHAARTAALVRVVRIMATGDFDGDGSTAGPDDFEPVRDLHVGVISVNMGSGAYPIVGCEPFDFGDDARLGTSGSSATAGCAERYPTFLSYRAGESSPDQLASELTCVASELSGGCEVEQSLEAILKALSPSAPMAGTSPRYEPPLFFADSAGHGDGANAGFLRAHSDLAILLVASNDDCSARDPSLFDRASSRYDAPSTEIACAVYADAALHPIERYVEGLLQLRERPGRLFFSVIAGIPTDLAPDRWRSPDYDTLVSPDPALRDDRMELRIDPDDPTRLAPSCEALESGPARPALRLVELARRLEERGANVGLLSVCGDDFRSAIPWGPSRAFPPLCLDRPLDGDCEIEVVLPESAGCDMVPGSVPRTFERGDGLDVCSVLRLVPSAEERAARRPPAGLGWYLDDYTAEGEFHCSVGDWRWQRIAFTTVSAFPTYARLVCSVPVETRHFCSRERDDCGARGEALACDPIEGTCGRPCSAREDCAGFAGGVCDLRPRGEIDPRRFAGDPTPHGFCVSTTCG